MLKIINTIFKKDDIKRKFKNIVADKNAINLIYPGHIVSDKPIFSQNYGDCNGVALLNHDFVGLSHYDLYFSYHKKTSKGFLPELINEIKDKSNSDDITAVLIAGDYNNFEMNKEILNEFEIPIIGKHLDRTPKGGEYKVKDVVVIPSTQEVLIYTKGEYKKLA